MRDRLLKLCKKSQAEWLEKTYDHETEQKLEEYVADYLLANGVIVPPCKVGDRVYVIYNNNVIKGKIIAFDIVMEKDYVSFVAGVRFFGGILMNKGFAFGTNVFLTREEAEAKLKGEQ